MPIDELLVTSHSHDSACDSTRNWGFWWGKSSVPRQHPGELAQTYLPSEREDVLYKKSSYTQRRNRSGNHSFHYFLPYDNYLVMCTGWTHDVGAKWKCFESQLKYGQSIQTPSPRPQVWGRAGWTMCSSSGWWQLFGSSPREARRGTQKSIWADPAIKCLRDGTLDLETCLGYPWRIIMVLQDAVLVA